MPPLENELPPPADQMESLPPPVNQMERMNTSSVNSSENDELPPPADQMEKLPEENDSFGEKAKALAEGVGRGSTFGMSSGLEQLPIIGAKKEDISRRQEKHPILGMVGEGIGLGLTMATGIGEGALLAKAGTAVADLAGMGRLASNVIRTGIEGGLFNAGDTLSDAMLGKTDQDAPVASAISHFGAGMLFGSVTGGVLGMAGMGFQKLTNSVGSKLAQEAENFGNRYRLWKEVTEPVQEMTNELNNFHNVVEEGRSNDFFKDELAEKLVPKESSLIDSHLKDTEIKVFNALKEAQGSVDTRSAVSSIAEKLHDWKAIISDPNLSNADKFIETNKFKKIISSYPTWGDSESSAKAIVGKKIAQDILVPSLENSKAWGEMGNFQREVNKAWFELNKKNGPLKAFDTLLTKSQGNGFKEVDTGRVGTLFKGVGNKTESSKTGKNILNNYINARNTFSDIVDKYHDEAGISSPIAPASLNSVNEFLQKPLSPGAQLADALKNGGITSKGVDLLASLSHGFGGHYAARVIAPILEKIVGQPVNDVVAMAIMKTMSSEAYPAIPVILAHAASVSKGAKKIENAVSGVFDDGKSKHLDFIHSDKEREKTKKFIKDGGIQDQIQNTLNKQNSELSKPAAPPQRFAEGGNVEAKPNIEPVQASSGGISQVYPEQDMIMQTAKGRVYNYLNAQRPQEDAPKLPFDTKIDDKGAQRKYDKLVDLANQPLSILKNVKDGTLTADNMKHFTQMYPELYNHLSKKMTEKITTKSMSNEKPPYHVRQALSLFLGAPLDSSFKPSSIQAAQGVFMKQNAQNQQQMQAQSKPKKGTSGLSNVHNQYLTDDQGRIERQAKG